MSLLFTPTAVDAIRAGEKTATRRDWSGSYDPPPEGTVQMAVPRVGVPRAACDCFVRVDAVYQQRLGEMTDADAAAEGGYSRREFEAVWADRNGEPWDPDLVVDVVEFSYVGSEPPALTVATDD